MLTTFSQVFRLREVKEAKVSEISELKHILLSGYVSIIAQSKVQNAAGSDNLSSN